MFLTYIQAFRALAILFIVAGHSIDVFIWPENETLEKILRILVSNGTVLFVFIAGYLFQHLSKKFIVQKYYLTKFKYVLIPYFLISIPAIIVFVAITERDTVWPGFYDNPIWMQVVSFYLTGKHLAPLWFIPMITIFYFLAPILIWLDKIKYTYYFLPLFVLLSCFVPRSGMPYEFFIHFFSVYLLGMLCSHYKGQINLVLSRNSIILLLSALICILAFFEFYFMAHTMTYVNYLQKVVMSLAILGVLIKLSKAVNPKFIEKTADTSFGVFFIHSYILSAEKLIFEHFNGSLAIGNLWNYTIVAILTLIICIIIVQFIKYIFGKNSRILVGS